MSISELTESSIDYRKSLEEAEKELSHNLPPWIDSSCPQKCLTISLLSGIWFPVLILVSLVLGSYLAYTLLYIYPLLRDDGDTPEIYYWHSEEEKSDAEIKGICYLAAISLFLFMFFWSYYQSVFTLPGSIPNTEAWEIPSDSSESDMYSENLKETRRDGSRRVCGKCVKKKPDRAHHCKQCEVCVLKMDHHCNWIANCVGFYNYKFFLLMVFYGTLMDLFFLATFWECVVVTLSDNTSSALLALGVVLIYTLLLLLSFGLIAFSGFHIKLICTNTTTIEYCEKSSKARPAVSVYDKGTLRNFQEVLGENPLLWFIPVSNRNHIRMG